MVIAAALCAVIAPAAGATVFKDAHGKRIGVFVRHGVSPSALSALGLAPVSSASATGTPSIAGKADGSLDYNGGPVLHSSAPYLIFWDPSSAIPARSESVLEQYMTDAAAASGTAGDVYSVLRQYTDTTGFADYAQTFSGAQAIVDTEAYPTTGNCTTTDAVKYPTCITDGQVQTEISRLISANSLPTGIGADAPIYFVITPANVNVCDRSACASKAFCAYHSTFTDGPAQVLYAIVPFIVWTNNPTKGCQTNNPAYAVYQSPDSDQGDQIADNLSHELSETTTDPLLNAWWNQVNGSEVADICESYGPTPDPLNDESPNAYMPELGGSEPAGTLFDQSINGHHYYTQTNWSNGDLSCRASASPASITPQFAVSTPSTIGTLLNFDPAATTSTRGVSSVSWNFGDGSAPVFSTSSPTAVQHAFSAPGNYTVTLTFVDTVGNLATISHVVHIVDHLSSPSAAFAATPSLALTGRPVAFDAAGSGDPNGAPFTSYSWSFGDGTSGSGVAPAHAFAAPGAYTVTMTVTDSVGLAGQVSHVVNVASLPNASFTVLTPAVAGSGVKLDAGGSTDPNGALLRSYSWSFGDGSHGSGQKATHAYAKKGPYSVTLTVTDSLGLSSTVVKTVSIGPPIQITKVVIKRGKIMVTANGPGRLTIGRSHRTLSKGQTVTYRLVLTSAQKRQLRRRHKLTMNVGIKFVPIVGRPQSRTAKIRFRR